MWGRHGGKLLPPDGAEAGLEARAEGGCRRLVGFNPSPLLFGGCSKERKCFLETWRQMWPELMPTGPASPKLVSSMAWPPSLLAQPPSLLAQYDLNGFCLLRPGSPLASRKYQCIRNAEEKMLIFCQESDAPCCSLQGRVCFTQHSRPFTRWSFLSSLSSQCFSSSQALVILDNLAFPKDATVFPVFQLMLFCSLEGPSPRPVATHSSRSNQPDRPLLSGVMIQSPRHTGLTLL